MDAIDAQSERYGLSPSGLHQRLYTGEWRLVRTMTVQELARVRSACIRLPEKASQLLRLLDPSDRTPDDPAETWAEAIIAAAELLKPDVSLSRTNANSSDSP